MSLIIAYKEFDNNNKSVIKIISDSQITDGNYRTSKRYDKVLPMTIPNTTTHFYIGITGLSKFTDYINYLYKNNLLNFNLLTDISSTSNLDLFFSDIVKKFIEDFKIINNDVDINVNFLTVINNEIYVSKLMSDMTIETEQCYKYGVIGIEANTVEMLLDYWYNRNRFFSDANCLHPFLIMNYMTEKNMTIGYPIIKYTYPNSICNVHRYDSFNEILSNEQFDFKS